MDDTARDNFDSFEDFQDVAEEMETFDLDEEFDNIRGEQEEMRDATSELAEAAGNLGQVFNEQVTEAISDFASAITRVVDRIDSMEESVQDNIGRFAILAVSIGLVLGPLLLIGGQIALIGAAMGKMLIPFLGVAAILFGAFATAIATATSDGDDAEGMLGGMQNILSGLIDFLQEAVYWFNVLILWRLRELGDVSMDIFWDIVDGLSEIIGTSSSAMGPLFDIAWAINRVIDAFTEFLDDNSEE